MDLVEEPDPEFLREKGMIDGYFLENYSEGQRVDVPWPSEQNPTDWLQDQTNLKMSEEGYEWVLVRERFDPEKHKPRISLRSGDHVSPGHHEWKIWVQVKRELAALGEGSLVILKNYRGDSRPNDRVLAKEKIDEMAERLNDEIFKKLLSGGEKNIEIRQLAIIHKLRRRNEFDDAGDADSFREPSLIICEEVVRSLIRPSITHRDSDGEMIYSITGIDFLSQLSNGISRKIRDLIGESKKLHEITLPPGAQGLELSSKEEEDYQKMVKDGFGGKGGSRQDKGHDMLTMATSRKLAYGVLNLMRRHGLLENTQTNRGDFIRHYGLEQYEKRAAKSLPNMIRFTPTLRDDWIGPSMETVNESDTPRDHPIFRYLRRGQTAWMFCHPREHDKRQDGTWTGGLLREKDSRTVTGRTEYGEFGTPRCNPSYDSVRALDILQGTQWEVNLDLLETICDFDKSEGKAMDPRGLRPKSEFERAIFHSSEKADTNKLTESQKRARDARNEEREVTLDWARKVIDHGANVFWHSWQFDFRGRMYPTCTNLSPQGDDFDKSMIRFKHWGPLGNRGIFWLRVHAYNLIEGADWGHGEPPQKNATFEERSSWVDENIDHIREIANSPSDHLGFLGMRETVTGKSDSFKRLAAILEIDRVYGKYYDLPEGERSWDLVSSGLPVNLDATCSLYQHISALLRNENLAKMVRVLPTEKFDDLYTKVSERARNNFKGDEGRKLRSILEGIPPDEIKKSFFSRSIAKKPTMLTAYGGQDFRRCFEGRNGEGSAGFSKVDKTEAEILSEKAERDSVPVPIKDAFENYESGKWEKLWFVSKVGQKRFMTENGSTAEERAKQLIKLLRDYRWKPHWHFESPLYEAVFNNDCSPLLAQKLECDYELQSNITTELVKIYKKAIEEITGNAYLKISEALEGLLTEGGLYENAVNWKMEDKFRVYNYAIRKQKSSAGKKSPTFPDSMYKHLLPRWCKDPQYNRTFENKIKDFYSAHGIDSEALDEIVSSKSRQKKPAFLRLLTEGEFDLSEEASNELAEIKWALGFKGFSISDYDDNEEARVDKRKMKSSIMPNFIHSLDAEHMRRVIERMTDGERLDFFAVHDSFGTHPSRIDELREAVREGFYDMYGKKDINYYLSRMKRGDDSAKAVDLQVGEMDPDLIQDSKYLVS
tara:strand:+ start:448 stop:3942 length:3495 start_codon:yes stop_codon:yes gene_type:complete